MAEVRIIYHHDADPDPFLAALKYSEANTGFNRSLIERDYYCSLILQYLFQQDSPLVFKGGTCLGKVYVSFYRLSEDLDFVIPVTAETTRVQRRAEMGQVKAAFENIQSIIPGVDISERLTGHNNSRQYIGYLSYRSVVIDKLERIKVEIGLREPLLQPSEKRAASTLAVNPFNRQPLISVFSISAMSLKEMYAEKLRAAMTKREPAIRDFFDLFYAVREGLLNIQGPDLISMVKAKLEVPGNDPIDLSASRKDDLDRQMETRLKPVLRAKDFSRFNLDEIFSLVHAVAKEL